MADMMDKITGAIEDLVYRDEELFKGEVECGSCGQVHTHEGLLDGGCCSNCQKPIKELF